ncbi:MAG: hypothetical protein KDA41_08760, partial [Planctomycetales bacterium]|nr:hypothetical protein [Planctomycetales bacterium]
DFPEIAADEVGPARLTVTSDDNVVVAPVAGSDSGWQSLGVAAGVNNGSAKRAAAQYEQADRATAPFACQVETHPQELHIDVSTSIQGEAETLQVTQRFDYDVRFEPLRSVALVLPADWPPSESPRTTLDGEPVGAESIYEAAQDDPAAARQLNILLGDPTLGKFSLEVAWRVPATAPAAAEANSRRIGLLTPMVDAGAASLTISPDASHALEVADDQWTPDGEAAAQPTAGRLRFTSKLNPSSVMLRVQRLTREPSYTTLVDRAWWQSWFSEHARQDRAVYALRTNRPSIIVDVPPAAMTDDMVVLVDGAPTNATVDGDGAMHLDLPHGNAASDANANDAGEALLHRHVVELWLRRSYSLSRWGGLRWEPPRIRDAWIDQSMWHVVLPSDVWVAGAPPGMHTEMTWDAQRLQRRPRLGQTQLESWAGASAQASPDDRGAGTGELLFSSVGDGAQLEVAAVGASATLLVLTFALLGVCVLVLYVPFARQPIVWTTAAAVVVYLAFRWPTIAAAGAGALALVLATLVVAGLVEHALRRSRGGRQRVAPRSGASEVRRSPSTRAAASAILASPPSTTATAAAMPMSGSEVK